MNWEQSLNDLDNLSIEHKGTECHSKHQCNDSRQGNKVNDFLWPPAEVSVEKDEIDGGCVEEYVLGAQEKSKQKGAEDLPACGDAPGGQDKKREQHGIVLEVDVVDNDEGGAGAYEEKCETSSVDGKGPHDSVGGVDQREVCDDDSESLENDGVVARII